MTRKEFLIEGAANSHSAHHTVGTSAIEMVSDIAQIGLLLVARWFPYIYRKSQLWHLLDFLKEGLSVI